MIRLYSYFRSSADYRVRIALNLKNVAYEQIYVHLVRNGGEQFTPQYQALNPLKLVPTLQDGELTLTQSLAIIEYLDEKYKKPALLPATILQRAKVRAFAQVIACEIHPINNLRVQKYLTGVLKISEENKLQWYKHWVAEGLQALEALLTKESTSSQFCFGDQPTLADICLVPQIYNANRFQCPLQNYPNLLRIYDNCISLPAFDKARPEKQADAEK